MLSVQKLMFLEFWDAQDQKMSKCVCEISSHSHCMVSVANRLSAPGCLHEEHSLTRHWHQWGFMAKTSLTNFIKSAHKRAWCIVNNTFFLEVKEGCLLFREELLGILFLICYFKIAVWTALQASPTYCGFHS